MTTRSTVIQQMCQVKRANLVLVPNGVQLKHTIDASSNRDACVVEKIQVDILYGGSVFQCLALVGDRETDIMLTNRQSEVLPEDELEMMDPPVGTTLLDHMTWLVRAIQQYQRGVAGRNEDIRETMDKLDQLKEIQIVADYEVCSVEDRVTFLVKANLPQDDFSSLQVLLGENRLVNSNEDFFLLKMVFDRNTGRPVAKEFSMQLSAEVSKLFPPSDTMGIPRMTGSAENLEDYFMTLKDGVENRLAVYRKKLRQRARFILSLSDIFKHNIGRVDMETMLKVSVIFVVPHNIKCVLVVNLDENFPETHPSYTLQAKQCKEDGTEARRSEVVKSNLIPFNQEWSLEKNALSVGRAFQDGGLNILRATFNK